MPREPQQPRPHRWRLRKGAPRSLGVALLACALTISAPQIPSAAVTDSGDDAPRPLERLTFNNPGLTVDLGVGLQAWPLPMDADEDGDLDLLVSSPDVPYNGLYFFENITGNVSDPVFAPAVRIGYGRDNVTVSHTEAGPVVTTPGSVYPEITTTGFYPSQPLDVAQPVHDPDADVRANQWSHADYDGDGALDLVVGIGDWSDYGIPWSDGSSAYDADGNWTNGPLHGHVYVLRNLGTTEAPEYAEPEAVHAGGQPVDVYGMPSPNLADFDGDGDLDLVTGEFLDTPTYFENVGTRTAPEYAEGRPLPTVGGGALSVDLEMMVVSAVDWTGDGHVDLVIGQEDGRVMLAENTGTLSDDGRPVFAEPTFFQQQADNLKIGALATPVSVDWDGDGHEDLIAGDTAGRLSFVKNLDGGDPPQWAEPQYLTAGGEEIRIMAGPNGSVQGPSEAKWGYTAPSVADWDGDGLKDIVVNSILGEVVWYRNVGTATAPELAPAEPIEVDWPGETPKPSWNWWDPEGDQLVTQWRTTPFLIDLNEDGLMDLVSLDHEGYLAFFERRSTDAGLVLSPGQRIFIGEEGSSRFNRHGSAQAGPRGPLQLNTEEAGGSGRRKFTMVDWTGDGRLDLLLNNRPNVQLLENVGTDEEPWVFRDRGSVADGQLAGHTTSPTVVNWDGDDRPDLLIGAEDGHLYYQRWNYQEPGEEGAERVSTPPEDPELLVGEWRFDDGAGYRAADSSSYDNYGVVNGARWTDGYVGGGLAFDGFNDFVDLDYTVGPYLDGASGLTFSAWVNVDSIEHLMRIFGSRINGGRAGFEVDVRGGDGTLVVAGRSVSGDGYLRRSFDLSAIEVGRWQHIAAALDYEKDEIRLYVDGNELEPVDTRRTDFDGERYEWGTPSQPDTIGRSPDGTGHFSGALDNARVFRDGFGQAEVSLSLLRDMLDHHIEDGAVGGPLAQSLPQHLRQAWSHLAEGRLPDARDAVERFHTQLTNPDHERHASQDARAELAGHAERFLEAVPEQP